MDRPQALKRPGITTVESPRRQVERLVLDESTSSPDLVVQSASAVLCLGRPRRVCCDREPDQKRGPRLSPFVPNVSSRSLLGDRRAPAPSCYRRRIAGALYRDRLDGPFVIRYRVQLCSITAVIHQPAVTADGVNRAQVAAHPSGNAATATTATPPPFWQARHPQARVCRTWTRGSQVSVTRVTIVVHLDVPSPSAPSAGHAHFTLRANRTSQRAARRDKPPSAQRAGAARCVIWRDARPTTAVSASRWRDNSDNAIIAVTCGPGSPAAAEHIIGNPADRPSALPVTVGHRDVTRGPDW